MKQRTKSCSRFFLPVLGLASFSFASSGHTAPADATPDNPITFAERAHQAEQEGRTAEAALYLFLSKSKPIKTQGDVDGLLTSATNYARNGEFDKAVALWEYVLKVPAVPGARTPGMFPSPLDYRGTALWGIAESRRAQSRWDEALDFYQRDGVRYSLSRGCVEDGTSLETVVLVKSACLENLGRYGEAVKLLWSVARGLRSNLPPRALRHLVDLYLASGQMSVLETAVAGEKQRLRDGMRRGLGLPDGPFPENEQRMFERTVTNAGFSSVERVRHFRKAARERRWDVLLAALHYRENEHANNTAKRDVASWNRREAIVALSLVADEAAPVLERALARRQNPYYRAAWMACVPLEQRQSWLEQLQNVPEALTTYDEAMKEDDSHLLTPLVFPKPPTSLRLPIDLIPAPDLK